MFFVHKKFRKPPQKVAYLWQLGFFFLYSPDYPKQARTSFPFYKSFYSIVSAKVSVSNAVQKLQLNDLLIFPRIYEPLKRWAPNALETLHKKNIHHYFDQNDYWGGNNFWSLFWSMYLKAIGCWINWPRNQSLIMIIP